MEQIKHLDSQAEFVGIGGKNMSKLGLNSIVRIEDISVVGFWEVAKRYSFFKRLIANCKEILRSQKVDAFIPVDYPGFNLRLAEYARQIGLPVHYFIAPQLWAWGKNRAKNLAKSVNKLYVVFPFEKDFFERFGIETHFVGHPLLDNPKYSSTTSQRENIIALLPGSRRQEIERHIRLFVESAKLVREAIPDYRLVVAKGSEVDFSAISKYLNDNDIEIENDSIRLMQKAKFGIVKTGTSNLEAALAGMPFVMVYKTSPITYYMGKTLINLDYISIVNILLKQSVVKELIQQDANPARTSEELLSLAKNPIKYSEIINHFELIRKMLGGSGASSRAAQIITESLR